MISVCMASYNGANYIRSQIGSILVQLTEEDELIISDDGSTDGTLQIIESFEDRRIKLLHNDGKCYTKNFENALNEANGDYIFLSDQDDIWVNNKVSVTMKCLQQYDFVYSNSIVVDKDLTVIDASRNDTMNVNNGFIRNLVKTYYLGCCMAFNRKVLDVVLPFPPNSDLCRHDAWIALVSECYFRTYVCEDRLIYYRRHNSNASSGSIGITNSLSRMIRIRVYLLWQVLLRRRRVKTIT